MSRSKLCAHWCASVRASINCALTRTLLPALCTLPSSKWATPSCWPISRRLRCTPVLYCITDVRLITFRSATLARSVRISSCTPSVKNAFSLLSLKFSNGSTAILFSGIADEVAGVEVEFDDDAVVDLDEDRAKNQMAA